MDTLLATSDLSGSVASVSFSLFSGTGQNFLTFYSLKHLACIFQADISNRAHVIRVGRAVVVGVAVVVAISKVCRRNNRTKPEVVTAIIGTSLTGVFVDTIFICCVI